MCYGKLKNAAKQNLFGRKHQCISLDKYLLAFICDIDMSLLK